VRKRRKFVQGEKRLLARAMRAVIDSLASLVSNCLHAFARKNKLMGGIRFLARFKQVLQILQRLAT
jgi:hypothetical protein